MGVSFMQVKLLFFLGLWVPLVVVAQGEGSQASVSGRVTDAVSGAPVELATIYVEGEAQAVESAANGRYRIMVPAGQTFTLRFSRLGFQGVSAELGPLPARSNQQVDVSLVPNNSGLEVIVRESKIEEGGMVTETVEELKILPSASGNFESVLPHIALGTSSGTGGELTSQYNVRGGNYDENLVYVNDFAIYRPQLIRAGQQEGLTFPNIDLIRDLKFSSGGFGARYGDKLSSVLDINYKRPDSLRASASASLLGASAHLEGSMPLAGDPYRRFRYLLGARYKTNRYLLGSLDLEGEYVPNFTDFQAYLTYDLSRDWQLGFLGNYNRSVYRFTPTQRNTAFGLINLSLQLFSVFDGGEVDDFTTSMGGLSLTYLPERSRHPLYLKFLGAVNSSDENERIDIRGFYSLRQIDNNLGSSQFGEVIAELGTGTQHQFVRNFLDIRVASFQHKGGVELPDNLLFPGKGGTHFLQWSLKLQHERIADDIREWERLDSAGYSLPYDEEEVLLWSVLKSQNSLRSDRMSFFVEDTYTLRDDTIAEWQLTAGLRGGYWTLNREFYLTPRAQVLYKPLAWKSDISFRLAGGMYYQPPFYRELRRPDGSVNRDLLAQKSIHLVGGMTLDFYLGKRNPKKFRFITEAYYKRLWDLVSYDIENVRIRYSGENDARGHVAGIDFRLNGEFVRGTESWINLSFLTARERLLGVQHLERERGEPEGVPVATVPRPSDQRMVLSMFFQDYLPMNENFRMHLNLTVGTGLPFGIPNNNIVYRNTYRFAPYHRVDIGFSVMLWDREPRAGLFRNRSWTFLRGAWVSLEVFNLLNVENETSNTWIKTIFQRQYAIPNYLTSRRINLRFRVDF